jgi:Sodium / potassium ATPase beta chain
MIFGVIIGLSAVNIFMNPCTDRLEMADYGSNHIIRIDKLNIPKIIANLDEFWKRKLNLNIQLINDFNLMNHFLAYNVSDPKFHRCNLNESPPENKTCEVNIDDFSTCKRTRGYGLNRFEPCIFFKLKADTKWTPEIITDDDIPKKMPEDLQSYVSNWQKLSMSAVWFSCEGVHDQDKENLGPILYHPHLGFLSKYFPCQSEEICTSPIVAVQFEKLKSKLNILH